MVHSILETGIVLTVFAIGIVTVSKTKFRRKKFPYVIVLIITLVSDFIVAPYPLENIIVTSKTAIETCEYYLQKSDAQIDHEIDGKDSCIMLVNYPRATYGQKFARKVDNGWKACTTTSYKSYKTSVKGETGGKIVEKSVVVYKINKTDDYYISIFSMTSDPLKVTDNKNTDFYRKIDELYYGYVYQMDENYTLIIDGEIYNIGQELDF